MADLTDTRRAVLLADTAPEIEQRRVEACRGLAPAERLRLVSESSDAVIELALAGIRHRHPGVTEREQFLRLAVRPGVCCLRCCG